MKKCRLFNSLDEKALLEILQSPSSRIMIYDNGNVIFSQGETCSNLSIVLLGEVEIQKLEASGKVLTVSNLKIGDVFGENLLFGDKNKYPMNVISKASSAVLHLSKGYVEELCQKSPGFLTTLMQTLSNKAVALSSKLNEIGLRSLRQKICQNIYSLYTINNTKSFPLEMSKKEWAEKLAVQRPSLSRELIKLKDEGIIDYDKNTITLLDIEAIEDILHS